MPIDFRCPKGHKLQVADRLAGRTVRCPKCSAQAIVPSIKSDDNQVDDAEIELVEPAKVPRSAPVPAASSRRPSESAPAKPAARPAEQARSKPPAAGSKPRPPQAVVLLLAGLGGAAIVVLIGVGGFIGWRLASARSAVQESAAKVAESQPGAADLVSPATRPAKGVTRKRAEPVANADVDTPAEPAPRSNAVEKDSAPVADAAAAGVSASDRPHQTVELPAPMSQLVAGGSGKFLLAALPSVQKVAIVDVAAKKVARTVPIDDADCVIAAGETRFVVVQRGQGIIGRYNLETGQREATQSCEPYTALAMGSSSEGPLFAVGSKSALVDLNTLAANAMQVNVPFWNTNGHSITAAANGQVFTSANTTGSPRGMAVFEVDGTTLRPAYRHNSNSPVLPSPDGQVVYAEGKRYDAKTRPLGNQSLNRHESWLAYPAATGPFYMKLLVRGRRRGTPAEPLRLTIQYQGDDTPLLTVKGVELPDLALVPGSHEHPPLPPERRLFWMPVADAIVSVPDRCDQLVIQRFNLKEELDKSGTDYFQLASAPPRLFKRGQKISYVIEVVSKQGGVQYALENGPPGAAVSPEGVLTWDVPSDFSPHEALVAVKLQNGAGQELSHSFKLSDGAETPQVADVDNNRRLRATSRADVFAGRTRTVTAAALSPPKSVNENRWDWNGGSPICVRGEKGSFAGLILGDKLYPVKDSGGLTTQAVTLPSSYMAAGLRSGAIVGLAANPTRVEIVSRQGQLVRKVALDNVAPLALALHPQQPICYACLDLTEAPFRGKFVAIDEQAGTTKTSEEDLGQDAIVDPTGRFLVTSYVHQVNLGDQIVVTESPRGFAGSRRGRGGVPRYSVPRYGGRVPSVPAPAPRVGLMHRFLNVPLMLVYDLDSPLQPEVHSITPQKGGGGSLRISCDGRRLAMLQLDSKGAKYVACDPLDLKAATTLYDCELPAGRNARGTDLAFHPTLALNAVVGGGTLAYFDAESGKTLPTKIKNEATDLAGKSVRRALFSSDGKHLMLLTGGSGSDQSLVRVALPITPDQQAALRIRTAAHVKLAKANGTPLAEVTAWRGGLPKTSTTAQISADYGDAVVIVKTANSTGSGFFVGSSGLVLTCAHCASPLDATQVIYHPQGKTDQKITVDATILFRDRKTDLALLKIDGKSALHAVVLADPVDVKSGEDVTIIANPGLGKEVLDNTVTTGIISNIDRTIADNHYIQSSAAVNPGSSGGPMFDRNGEVIGVVVLKAGIDGVGFAVPPLSIAKFLLRATRRDGQKGRLERNWLDAAMKTEIPGILSDVKDKTVSLADKSGGEARVHPFSDFSSGDRKLLDLIEADE
jgi:S1-C subfamily serine protease